MAKTLPLSAKLKIISNAYTRALTGNLQSYGLTQSQAHIIGFLINNGGRAVCQHDIETNLGLKHPTVTGLLERLRIKGFVTFGEGEDRRCKTVSVTQKALDSYDDARRLIHQTDRELFGFLPEEKLAMLSGVLDDVIDNGHLTCRAKEGRK